MQDPIDKEKDEYRIKKFINKHHAGIFKMKCEIKYYNLPLNKINVHFDLSALLW